jgi:hypothetical protein
MPRLYAGNRQKRGKNPKRVFMAQNDWIKRSEPEFADQGGTWTLWLGDTVKQTAFGWDTTPA